jgi:hypothetical protein
MLSGSPLSNSGVKTGVFMTSEPTSVDVITIKEARKLLGSKAKSMTNGEIKQMITDYESLARHAIRDYMVRK